MARASTFFYQGDPTAQITSSLARAIFGDPQARAEQEQLQAQMDQRRAAAEADRARAGLYTSQTEGQGIQNGGGQSLPQLLADMVPRKALPQVALDQDNPSDGNFNAAFDSSIGPGSMDETSDAAMRRGLPAVMAAMGQMQGDKIDPRQMIGTLASFFGGDEMARRGLVAQGHSPTAAFAITPERADDIAAQDAGAKQKQAWGVADRQASASRYGADKRLVGTKYSADSSASASRYGSDKRLEGATYSTDSKGAGKAPGFDAIKRVFPGASMNSGYRSPKHNREVGGVSNSTHLGNRPGVQGYDMDVQPGMTVDEAAARIEAANPGVRVIEKRDETGRVGPNGKPLGGWHFALQNTNAPAKDGKSGGGAPPKPPKPVNAATMTMLNGVLDDTYDLKRFDPADQPGIRAAAATAYQTNGGNPVAAAQHAVFLFAAKRRAQEGRSRPGDPGYVAPKQAKPTVSNWGEMSNATVISAPPVKGARKAPDGHWYVKTHPGSPDPWSRVD